MRAVKYVTSKRGERASRDGTRDATNEWLGRHLERQCGGEFVRARTHDCARHR